jgi:hypothetical protein
LTDNSTATIPREDPGGGGALGLQDRLVAEEKRLTAAARLEWARFARSEIKAFSRQHPDGPRPAGNGPDPAPPPSDPGGRGSDS